jgi:HK97 family phage portal protein
MGIFDFLRTEKRAMYNGGNTVTTTTLDQPFTLDSLLSTDAITEDKVMSIPTARACLDLISSTIAQMPVYLYQEMPDGSIEKVDDKRIKLLNHEANAFLNGYNLKKNMVKDYVLYGAAYVAKYEAGNTILELNPIPARSVVVQKRVQNGYRIVGADILVSGTESGAQNAYGNQAPVKFKPHELVIALQNSHDGLTSIGLIKEGQDIFKQALSEAVYTQNLYERGALPLGLLKTEGRLNETQATSLRDAWRNLYGGVKNSAKTVVLQEGMTYEALSMKPNEIQMTDTRKATSSEICKLFNVPESMISTAANKYGSIEQNQLHFLKHTLSPIVTAFEAAMDKTLLLESEKGSGYFFRFDTSEIVRATEQERVASTVAGIQGGLFTINEARAKFDLPNIEAGDTTLVTPGATQTNNNTNQDNSQGGAQSNDQTGTSTN